MSADNWFPALRRELYNDSEVGNDTRTLWEASVSTPGEKGDENRTKEHN